MKPDITHNAFTTRTNILPPVVSVIWTYTGMEPDDIANDITTVYERQVTTTVNDIEHIESESLYGTAVIKYFSGRHYNLHMVPCRPGKPEHKGKVERGSSLPSQQRAQRPTLPLSS
jgi:hypothetical protein